MSKPTIRSKQVKLSGAIYLVVVEGARQNYTATVYMWNPDEFGSGQWEQVKRPVQYLWHLLREVYVVALANATGVDHGDILPLIATRRTKEALCLT